MLALLLMSLVLGASSFLTGLLPLSFVFSKGHLDRLSSLGTGLLLGTALGVIIPEGLEVVIANAAVDSAPGHLEIPTTRVALSLLFGFTFMLVIEQLVSSHLLSHLPHQTDHSLHVFKGISGSGQEPDVEFQSGLEDPEPENPASHREAGSSTGPAGRGNSTPTTTSRAIPLTFGLFIHGLADGLALGASALVPEGQNVSSHLSFIVFLALVIHKAPTALALTTSLLATHLPRSKCRQYLAIFSSSTPVGAMLSYLAFSFSGSGDSGWTGTALLISGASFLYVATVLQPVSEQAAASELQPATRVLHIVIGICIPFILSYFFGHGH